MSKLKNLCLVVSVGLSLCACKARGPEPNDREYREARQAALGKRAPAPTEGIMAPPPQQQQAGDQHPAILNPNAANETAPATYTAELTTAKGTILIDVTRAWSPNGADRFYNLVKIGYYTDVAFFRVISGFMAQVGLHGDPNVNRAWQRANIQDDPVGQQSNTRGMVSFAMTGQRNSRSVQFFMNFGDNSNLDGMRFTPFGRVRDMATVDALHNGYGEGAPRGQGPDQSRIRSQGNEYLRASFPQLDYIQSARILP